MTRTVHPWAWWAWALGVAGAVSLSTNPLLNLAIALGLAAVIMARRTDDPWARSVGFYFTLAGFVVGFRLVFQLMIGTTVGSTVLFVLPQVHLPTWAAGIRLGGPVTAEALAYTTWDSLRLGVMLLALGAANSLANPRRALRSVPPALYEASVAMVISLSVAPQLIESIQRVRRARRLRGGAATGWRAVPAVVVPVLSDAIDRSIELAAGMESRGFGRTRDNRRRRPIITMALVVGMMAVTVGGYVVLAVPSQRWLALVLIATGLIAVVLGLRSSGRRLGVTRYRPDRWTPYDTIIASCGLIAVTIAAIATAHPVLFRVLNPATDPVQWPSLHLIVLMIVAATVAPLVFTQVPPRAVQETA